MKQKHVDVEWFSRIWNNQILSVQMQAAADDRLELLMRKFQVDIGVGLEVVGSSQYNALTALTRPPRLKELPKPGEGDEDDLTVEARA